MSLAEGYLTLDATAPAELVRKRQVSPAELVETAIARREQVEPKLAGMAEWTVDKARLAAREPLSDSPFTGVPFLLTGNINQQPAFALDLRRASRRGAGRSPLRGRNNSLLVHGSDGAGLPMGGSSTIGRGATCLNQPAWGRQACSICICSLVRLSPCRTTGCLRSVHSIRQGHHRRCRCFAVLLTSPPPIAKVSATAGPRRPHLRRPRSVAGAGPWALTLWRLPTGPVAPDRPLSRSSRAIRVRAAALGDPSTTPITCRPARAAETATLNPEAQMYPVFVASRPA